MTSLARTAAKFRVLANQPSCLLTTFDSWQAFSISAALSVVMPNTLSCSPHEISPVSRQYTRTAPMWLSFSCLVSRTCEVNTTYLALEVLWYVSRNLICYEYTIYMNTWTYSYSYLCNQLPVLDVMDGVGLIGLHSSRWPAICCDAHILNSIHVFVQFSHFSSV